MAPSRVHVGTTVFSSSGTGHYQTTLPTVQTGDKMLYFIAIAAQNPTSRIVGQTSGVTFTLADCQTQSGQAFWCWQRTVADGAAESGSTVEFTVYGPDGTTVTGLKNAHGIVVIRDTSAFSIVGSTTGNGTSKTPATNLATANGSLRINAVMNSSGTTVTSAWVPPTGDFGSENTDWVQGNTTGTTALVGLAIGVATASMNNGDNAGGEAWTHTGSGTGGMFSIVAGVAAPPVLTYDRDDAVIIDTAGSEGTVTLTQTSGTTATIEEPTTGLFIVYRPADEDANMVFDLETTNANGTTTEEITIQPIANAGAVTPTRVVYRSSAWQ